MDDAIGQIDKIMFNRAAVQLIDLVLPIATKARSLIRNALGAPHGFKLKTPDAVHLASALHYRTENKKPVRQIQTYETEWPRYQTIIGGDVQIGRPDSMYVKNPKAPSVFR